VTLCDHVVARHKSTKYFQNLSDSHPFCVHTDVQQATLLM
jgi:hypothetical protein